MNIADIPLSELYPDEIKHYGVKGMKWGVRKDKNSVFISGSSKTQFKDSGYYRKQLPKEVKKEIDNYISTNTRINVGDAPGIDRQVQNYLNAKKYNNVVVYGPGKKVRYSANKKWKTKPIDAPEFEVMSPNWLAKKDKAMERDSSRGLAIILDNGAVATRNNIDRLLANNKNVSIYQLSGQGRTYDAWQTIEEYTNIKLKKN